LLTRYLEIAELEPSTQVTYEGYVRRTIEPALGSLEVRKVRGPMLDTLYARLRRCSDVSCVTGRPFIEHKLLPRLPDAKVGRSFRALALHRQRAEIGDRVRSNASGHRAAVGPGAGYSV
jgi:hypothetical protein